MPITINGNGIISGINDVDIVSASATNTPLIVQGASGQSADLLDVKNNAGTDLFSINSAGLLGGSGTSMGSWTSWTPTLTASITNPTLGTGSTTVGEYMRIGKLVVASFTIGFGTSGVASGNGDYYISLPIAASTLARKMSGTLNINDNSTNILRIGAPLFFITSTTISIRIDSTVGGGYTVTHAVPWTWAASDAIWGTIIYEAA